ncbi:hypothetical protein [Krasilnikovia sp. MM14-A1004]|uniref:hypothetical protein n=1 Tax=Krasilnikovia sp. MM14-A1004 TaxID=3373541 RepID=UPI00399D3700
MVYEPPPVTPDALRAMLTEEWTTIPLRIPGGWEVRSNGLIARLLPSGECEVSDSEDLIWLAKSPPPNDKPYETDPTSPWRELQVDLGCYGAKGEDAMIGTPGWDGCYRLVLLEPDWDHQTASWTGKDIYEAIAMLQRWLHTLSWTGALTPDLVTTD